MKQLSKRSWYLGALLILVGPGRLIWAIDLQGLESPQIPAIPHGDDDPEVRRLFEKQYPIAYEQLQNAVSRVQGVIQIEDAFQEGAEGSGSQHQSFSRFDDHVVFRATDSTQGAAFAGQGALVTPGQAARVERANTPSASVAFFADKINWRMKLLYDDRIRSFLDAAYSCGGAGGILDEIRRGAFQYSTGYWHPENADLIVVRFNYVFDGDDVAGREYEGTTTVVFNTAKGWPIEQFEDFRTAPSNFVIRGQIETVAIESLGRVPTHVMLEHYYDLKLDSKPGDIGDVPLYRQTSGVVSDLKRIDEFSGDKFSLPALGVSNFEPRRWWLVMVSGNLVFFLLILVYIYVRRRRSRSTA